MNFRSFGCVLFELIKLESLFMNENLSDLYSDIKNFDVNKNSKIQNITNDLFVQLLNK